jgi:hypothetical protein
VVSSDSKIADPEWVPPISTDKASYKFDEIATKAMIKQDSSLLKLNCD